MPNNELLVDLSDLTTAEIEVLAQQGGRGMGEFAASSCCGPSTATCSCVVDQSESQA
jgi:hypothetical protein